MTATLQPYLDHLAEHDEIAARAGTLASLPRLPFNELAILDPDTIRILREHLIRVHAVADLSAPSNPTEHAIHWLHEIESNLDLARTIAQLDTKTAN